MSKACLSGTRCSTPVDALARSCNFEIEDERYLFPSLVPVKLAVRAIEKLGRFPARVPSVPAPWLNQALYRISFLEQKLAMTTPLPFGNSLLVIGARRAQLRSDEPCANGPLHSATLAGDRGALL